MGLDPEKPVRRSHRLVGRDYAGPGDYFVTVCVLCRQCLFGEIVEGEMHLNGWGMIAEECWRAIPDHFGSTTLGAFIVMPNHLHGIIHIRDGVRATHASPLPSPGPRPGSVGAIVGAYKSAVARRINTIRGLPGTLIWQRDYYEHIIRDDTERSRIQGYIWGNPQRWAEDRENPNP